MPAGDFQEPAGATPANAGPPPRVWVSHGRALYAGPALKLAPHRNAVTTAVIGLKTEFELVRDGQASARLSGRLALVPAGIRHQVIAHGPMAFLYLDPSFDDVACAALASDAAAMADGGSSVSRRVCERLDQAPATSPIADIADLLGIATSVRPHRMARVVAAIAAAPEQFERIEEAAELAGLSVSRFQHLFRDEIGLPFRRFRLWHRMLRVAELLQAGDSLTAAAHEAGFSSSSHLSTAFREMFGLAPSALVSAGTRFVVERPAGLSVETGDR